MVAKTDGGDGSGGEKWRIMVSGVDGGGGSSGEE